MKYVHLVWVALFSHKTRTVLTLLSVSTAFLLFGLLDSVGEAFTAGSRSIAGASRLVTQSKVSITLPLPQSLLPRIASVPGVERVSYVNWFGGIYQDPKNFFPNEAVGPGFLAVHPEFVLPAAQRRAFADTRTGVVVGESLARRFHWKIGDKIPMTAGIFPQKDGSNTWTFDLVGIYRVSNPRERREENAFYFHWEYFDEARAFGHGTVGWYVEKIARPGEADRIARTIDAISADSDHETKTQSEDAFAASFVSQFADVGLISGSIMGAVFFTLILLTGNTMAQAVRERIPELAILKTLGFSNRSVLSLVLGESVLLLVLGGVGGLAVAAVMADVVRATLGAQIPMAPVGLSLWLRGLGLMTVIGLLVGVLPAQRGMKLRIVDALAEC